MPQIRDYPQVTSIEPTDALIMDREGDGTVYAEADAFLSTAGGPISLRAYGRAPGLGTPTVDAGAPITAAIVANGGVEYDFGGYSYLLITGIVITTSGVVLQGSPNLILGASDTYAISIHADGCLVDNLRLTNPNGYNVTDNSVFPLSAGIFIHHRTAGNIIRHCRIEGFINGVIEQGLDISQPSTSNSISNCLISVLPHNFGAYAGWPNAGIASYSGSYGLRVDTCTVVVYSGAGIFTNLTGTAYTYCNVGIALDVSCYGALVTNSVVGQGFDAPLYNDGQGNEFNTCTAFPGYHSTVAGANTALTNCLVKAPTYTGGGGLNASVTVTGGATLVGNRIEGGSASVPLILISNTGAETIIISSNRFSGTYSHGVSGNPPGNLSCASNAWAGTCTHALYNIGMVSSTATAGFSNDVQTSGLVFETALAANPLYRATITGNNWAGCTSSNIALLGGVAMSITVIGNRLANANAANASLFISNGATVPDVTMVGNECTGPTYSLLVNTAANSSTRQQQSANVNNTRGTF